MVFGFNLVHLKNLKIKTIQDPYIIRTNLIFFTLLDVEYEKLFNGTVSEKLIIAKIFKENYDILENMKK